MISCSDFIAEIGNYLEGDLATETRAQIESHLAHCKTCQIVYDSTRKTVKVLTESGCFDLPEAASKAVRERVMAGIRSKRTDL